MIHSTDIAPVSELKEQARRLRDRLKSNGTRLSHSEALELLAHQLGARDWNTLRAQSARAQSRLAIGGRVTGRYLGQPFSGVIHSLTALGASGNQRVTVHFDTPVDVVRFDSFSALRQRVSSVIGWDGRSLRKTSDGQPHMVLNLPT